MQIRCLALSLILRCASYVTCTADLVRCRCFHFYVYDKDFEGDASDSDDGDRCTNVYVFDFSEVFGGKTCTESDFEYWYQSEGKCVNGGCTVLGERAVCSL